MTIDLRVAQAPGYASQFSDEDHADGDRCTVAPLVPLGVLDRVSQGVAVVEDLTQPGFLEV